MRMSIMRPGGRWDGEEKREKGEEREIGGIQLEALYTAWHRAASSSPSSEPSRGRLATFALSTQSAPHSSM